MGKSTSSFAFQVHNKVSQNQGWTVMAFFFFMDEQDMPVQLQETGVKGQRRLWQQGFWVSERCIIPHRLWPMCLCDPSPWFSCWPSKWQRNPTWKCHCIDCLRCGTAHSGDVGRMAEAKVSRQAAWRAGCFVRASCLPWSSVSSHCPTHWVDFHLPAEEHGKGGKWKTHCPSFDGWKQHEDLEGAQALGNQREMAWVLALLFIRWGLEISLDLWASIYSSIRGEQ